MQQFDPDLPGLLQGKITSLVIIDPTEYPPLELGNHVLDPTKPFDIKINWKLRGQLVPLWLKALRGSWSVQVFAESIGGGPEITLASNNRVAADPTVCEYEAVLTVPANTLPEGNPGGNVSGIYKLATSVFLNSKKPELRSLRPGRLPGGTDHPDGAPRLTGGRSRQKGGSRCASRSRVSRS